MVTFTWQSSQPCIVLVKGMADTESYKAARVLMVCHLTKNSCPDTSIFPR